MKIIFLDIDGVLNYSKLSADDVIRTPSGTLSKRAISLLNKLTDDSGAKIVISSTWRLDPSNSAKQSLILAGVTGDIISTTPNGCSMCIRGNEIRQWLVGNRAIINCYASDFKDYVILDDDSDMLYWQRNNFVLVDSSVGLTQNIIYRANRKLDGHV